MCSCINYNTFCKLNVQLTQREVPKVIGVDGGDLGSMGTVQLMLRIGASKVTQDFIVCRELRRNIILGVDFAKQNCAGIQWTTNRTRVLSLNGVKVVEVEEDELGIPCYSIVLCQSSTATQCSFLKSTSMQKHKGRQ